MNQSYKKILLFEAFIFVVLGVLSILWPAYSTKAIEEIIGWLFIISGVLQTVRCLFWKQVESRFFLFFLSILYVLAGFYLLAFPKEGVLSLTYLLIGLLIAQGIMQIFFGYQATGFIKGAYFLGGLISFLLGIVIFLGLPQDVSWILGTIVGINLVCLGAIQGLLAMHME